MEKSGQLSIMFGLLMVLGLNDNQVYDNVDVSETSENDWGMVSRI